MENDIKKLSTEKLKAISYDHIISLDNAQRVIKIISEELASRQGNKMEEEVKVEETVVEETPVEVVE